MIEGFDAFKAYEDKIERAKKVYRPKMHYPTGMKWCNNYRKRRKYEMKNKKHRKMLVYEKDLNERMLEALSQGWVKEFGKEYGVELASVNDMFIFAVEHLFFNNYEEQQETE